MNNLVNHSPKVGGANVLFEPPSWLLKIDFMNQLILNNNVLISLLGKKGSGKTSFAHMLQEKIDLNIMSVVLTAAVPFEQDKIVEQMSTLLDVSDALSVLDIAVQMNERKAKTLVLIDDAEHLHESFIIELLEALKQQGEYGYFHVCLLSDFSLVKLTSRLARDQYKDMIHSIELDPLNESEAKAYIADHMVSTSAHQSPLTVRQLQDFYALTEGFIGSINEKFDEFLEKQLTPTLQWNDNFIIYGAIAILLLFVTGIGYFLYSEPSNNVNANELEQLASRDMELSQIELPMTSEVPVYSQDATHQAMQTVHLQKAELLVKRDDEDVDGIDESLVVLDKVIAKPTITPPPKKVKPQPTPKPATPARQVHKRPMQKHLASVRSRASLPQKTYSPVLMSPKGQFTIQLFAGRDKHKLEHLARTYGAISGIKICSFEKHGETWYVLTKGGYANKQMAHHAVATLPQKLVALKPWVRSTSNLKSIG